MLETEVRAAQEENNPFKNTSLPNRPQSEIKHGDATITLNGNKESTSFTREQISDSIERLSVTGPSAASRFWTMVGAAARAVDERLGLGRAAILALTGIGTVLVAAQKSSGSLILDTSTDAAHVQAAQPYVNAGSLGNGVAINVSFQGQSEWVSGFLIDPYDVATCAHCVESSTGLPYTINAVVEGYNYNSPTFTAQAVGNGIVDPKFNISNPLAGYDQAVIHLATAAPMTTATTFGTMTLNELDTAIGIGQHGSPSTGLLPQDGNFRAFQAPVIAFGDAGQGLSTQYGDLEFGDNLGNFYPMDGLGENGDSGGQVLNSLGQTVAMMARQEGGDGQLGTTYAESIDTGFYAANTSSVPEPNSMALVLICAGGLMFYRGRGPSLRMSDYVPSNSPRIRRRAA